jgi:FkbM family methyltransferase
MATETADAFPPGGARRRPGSLRARWSRLVHATAARLGFRVERLARPLLRVAPWAARAPVGELRSCLEGLRARGLAPRQVVDVGAHEGAWSRVAREVFPGAAFTLVEPRVEMAPHLERFCAETPGSRWVRAGAGRREGELPLAVRPDGGSSSFLASAVEWAESDGGQRRTAPVVTLDSLCAGAPPPELVKIDAEGFELAVLAGAETLLGATEVFILEAAFFRFRPDQPTFVEIVRFMDGRGYRPYDFAWFLRRPLDGALGLADVVFARADGPLRADRRWE